MAREDYPRYAVIGVGIGVMSRHKTYEEALSWATDDARARIGFEFHVMELKAAVRMLPVAGPNPIKVEY